jgi:GntR family transcriptional regulator
MPLYAQVRDRLLTRVRAGEWGAGESLPNEQTLSMDFDVSIGTVRRAVAELEANGVLVRKQGRGTFVSGAGPHALQQRFCGLRSPDGARLSLCFDLIELSRRPATPEEAALLPAAAAHNVAVIVQRVASASRTIGMETSLVPAALVPRLETQLRFGQHLYPVLADYGLLVTRVDDTIGIGRADASEADAIGCATGTALLRVSRRTFAIDGRPVELRSACYLPDLVHYAGACSTTSAAA